jgi:hypothetical protein
LVKEFGGSLGRERLKNITLRDVADEFQQRRLY